jgi:phage tail sheath protein FI
MAQRQSPGIYSDVFTFQDYTPADPGTIACILGGATKGATNKPTKATSSTDLIRQFGDPVSDDYGLIAAVDFLDNGGGTCLYTRVASSTAATGSKVLNGDIGGSLGAQATATVTIGGATGSSPADACTIAITDNTSGGALTKTFEFENPAGASGDIPWSTSTATGNGDTIAIDDGFPSGVTKTFEFRTTAGTAGAGNVEVLIGGGNSDALANFATAVNATTVATWNFTATINAGTLTATVTHGTNGTAGNTTMVITSSAGGINGGTDVALTGGSGSGVGSGNIAVTSGSDAQTAATNLVAAINALATTTLSVGAEVSQQGIGVTPAIVTLTCDTAAATGTASASDAADTGNLVAIVNFSGGADAVTGSSGAVITFNAASPGTWGNNLKVSVVYPTAVIGGGATNYDLSISAPIETGSSTYQTVESYTDLSNDSSSTRYVVDILGGKRGVSQKSDYLAVAAADVTNAQSPATASNQQLAGGADGYTDLTYSDYVGTVSGTSSTGLKATKNSELYEFNLLLVPGQTHSSVVSEMLTVAAARGDTLALIDTPLNLSPQQATDWTNGSSVASGAPTAMLNDAYGACYWPWVKKYQSHLNKTLTCPPSGVVAGAMARVDDTIGPWRAAAGYIHGAVKGDELEYSPLQADRDTCQGSGNVVNPLVQLSDGLYIFGNRTLSRKDEPMDAVHVTRLITYLRSTVSKAVRPLLFAPNDQDTWREFTAIVQPIMEAVKSQRGVEAYQVKCDAETNTPAVRAQKILSGRIKLQHIDAAEVIQLDFALTPTTTDLSVSTTTTY